jgi:hypothetical protein
MDAVFKESYRNFLPTQKWRLPGGSTVEDTLYSTYWTEKSHRVRNLIVNWVVDLNDKTVEGMFTREDWEAISSWAVTFRAHVRLHLIEAGNKKRRPKNIAFRYGESNPGLAGLMLYMRAADASHYTITDFTVFSLAIALFKFQPAFPSLSARSLPGTQKMAARPLCGHGINTGIFTAAVNCSQCA